MIDHTTHLQVSGRIADRQAEARARRLAAEADGRDVVVRLPQDPGQAGKDQAQTFARELAGFRVVTKPVTGDKTVRAGPLSSQVGARNVGLVRGPWVDAFVAQAHAFPDTKRDDKVDAAADAFSELAGAPIVRTDARPAVAQIRIAEQF